jgi:hypothetical protein
MAKPPDDRLAQALRENLKRRKAGARKPEVAAADEAAESPGGEEAGETPTVPVDRVRPNTAEKKS